MAFQLSANPTDQEIEMLVRYHERCRYLWSENDEEFMAQTPSNDGPHFTEPPYHPTGHQLNRHSSHGDNHGQQKIKWGLIPIDIYPNLDSRYYNNNCQNLGRGNVTDPRQRNTVHRCMSDQRNKVDRHAGRHHLHSRVKPYN